MRRIAQGMAANGASSVFRGNARRRHRRPSIGMAAVFSCRRVRVVCCGMASGGVAGIERGIRQHTEKRFLQRIFIDAHRVDWRIRNRRISGGRGRHAILLHRRSAPRQSGSPRTPQHQRVGRHAPERSNRRARRKSGKRTAGIHSRWRRNHRQDRRARAARRRFARSRCRFRHCRAHGRKHASAH